MPDSRVASAETVGTRQRGACAVRCAPPDRLCVCLGPSPRLGRLSSTARRVVVSTERCEPPAWPPEELSKKATSLHVLSSSITETSRHVLGGDVARSGETRDVPTSRVTTSHDGVMMPRLDRAPTFVLAALGPTCD